MVWIQGWDRLVYIKIKATACEITEKNIVDYCPLVATRGRLEGRTYFGLRVISHFLDRLSASLSLVQAQQDGHRPQGSHKTE